MGIGQIIDFGDTQLYDDLFDWFPTVICLIFTALFFTFLFEKSGFFSLQIT